MKKDNSYILDVRNESSKNQLENGLKLIKSLSTVMKEKLSEVKNDSHTKSGIFDMDVFLNRLNFIFKCLGIKHSKCIGYKMQTIIILGYLFVKFNFIMLRYLKLEQGKNWGLYEIFQSIYFICLNYKMMRTINEGNILETIFKSSLSLEVMEQNSS